MNVDTELNVTAFKNMKFRFVNYQLSTQCSIWTAPADVPTSTTTIRHKQVSTNNYRPTIHSDPCEVCADPWCVNYLQDEWHKVILPNQTNHHDHDIDDINDGDTYNPTPTTTNWTTSDHNDHPPTISKNTEQSGITIDWAYIPETPPTIQGHHRSYQPLNTHLSPLILSPITQYTPNSDILTPANYSPHLIMRYNPSRTLSLTSQSL